MLGTIDFRCFGKHARAALRHQQVAGVTKRRVGGDAGQRVRPATLQRHHELGDRTGGARGLVDLGKHLADHRDPGFNRLCQPH